MMNGHKLDAMDLKILDVLQREGRITNEKLARHVGLTPPPCLRRVFTLEECGYIKGYHADIDGPKLGFAVTAFVYVGLLSQSAADIEAFERRIRAWTIVRECYAISGEIDFILRCVATSADEFNRFLMTILASTPNVKRVRSAIVVRKSSEAHGVHLNTARVEALRTSTKPQICEKPSGRASRTLTS